MIQRPCLNCSGLITYKAGVSRCPACERAYNAKRDAKRGGRIARGYDETYRRNAAKVRAYSEANDLPCELCHKPFAPKELRSIDHIEAVSKGGTGELENLRAVHLECNISRGNKSDEAWRKRNERIGPA